MTRTAVGLLLVGLATAQSVEEPQVPGAKRRVEPVRAGEAYTAWSRIEVATCRVLKLDPPVLAKLDPEPPVTRAQVVEWMHAAYVRFRPRFLLTPRPGYVDERALAERTPDTVRDRVRELVRAGFVGPVGPLVVGPGEGLSMAELADAYGFFAARLADLTHRPSQKYSPDLMPDG